MCDETRAIVAPQQGLHLMPLLSLEQAITRRQALVEFIARVMVKGVDYGPGFPGADKDTLLKPGAERLNSYFGLTPTFHAVEAVEDWTGQDHGGEPFFYFWYKCKLWRGDYLIAEGDGSCNTWESKYRYRKAERVCPACGQAAIIKGKAEYGGGWLCWAKKGGCGAKYRTGDPAIEGQEVGRVLNPDPADQVNTCKKISQKRALIAATLLAVNASEFFTQDLDDMDTGAIGADYEVKRGAETTNDAPRRPTGAETANGSAKCPVCRATGDAHAPWCVEVDGGRIDNRKANGPKAAGKAPATADPDGGELDKALGRTPANGNNGKAERGDPPARAPQALLKLVNSRVEVGYDSIHHLTRAIKAELGDGWKPWPTFNDSDGWWTAYDAAVKHAEAKVKPEAAPAAAGDEPLPF